MRSGLRRRMVCALVTWGVGAIWGGGATAGLEEFGPGPASCLYDFRIPKASMILGPGHLFNFSGSLSVRPDVERLGFFECFSPPYAANPFRGTWKLDGKPIEAADYLWYPSETIVQSEPKGGVVFFQRLMPLAGERAFVCQLIAANRGQSAVRMALSLEMDGRADRMEGWGWMPPAAAEKHGSVQIGASSFVLASERAAWAAVCRPETPRFDERSRSFTFDLAVEPHETQDITVLVCLSEPQGALPRAEALLHELEEKQAQTTRRWQERIERLKERLPRLVTKDAKLSSFYERCLLTFLTTQWELDEAVTVPWYSESGIDGGAVCNYLWGDAYLSRFLPLADPAAARALLLTSMQADYSRHYAIDFLRGEGLGVSYSYNYYSMALLTYDYIVLTGDTKLLDEPVRGKPYLDALYDYVFEREDMAALPALIDYGRNENLLELRRTRAYEHFTPSPNLERILSCRMMDEMYRWKGRTAPGDLAGRAEKLQEVLLRELWNEDLKWFHSLDENRHPQVCYSVQVFDMLRTEALSPAQAQALVSRLNEDEFLSAWGVHSLSKKDAGYDPADVDWGGPGVYAGDASQLAEDLLAAGFALEGIEVLRRILWWGELPYIPQALRADSRDYRRDGRANVIAAMAGPQAIVWGLFGIRADGRAVRVCPVLHPYVAGMQVDNLCIRGTCLKIAVDPEGVTYSVEAAEKTVHQKLGQSCEITIAPLVNTHSEE